MMRSQTYTSESFGYLRVCEQSEEIEGCGDEKMAHPVVVKREAPWVGEEQQQQLVCSTDGRDIWCSWRIARAQCPR